MNIDFTQVTGVTLNNTAVEQIEDANGNVLWSAVAPDYFYIEDISGSDNTLSIKGTSASAPAVTVYKSTDGRNWSTMGTTSTTAITATIPANGKLYLKATTNSLTTNYNNYNYLSTTGNHNIGGKISSLIFGDNYDSGTITNATNNYAFAFLFYNDTHLVDASDLVFPSTTATRCYQSMFQGCTNLVTPPYEMYGTTAYANQCESMFSGCTSLTTAPVLPATTMSENCYQSMFANCTSLTTAPALNATTLANRCYGYMFSGCTSLTTAPATLPATTMFINCYKEMFRGCRALTTAPTLPATTLASGCYNSMFYGCSILNSVTTYAEDISATDCTHNWLYGVASTGDFYNYGDAEFTTGDSGIPTGWTEHRLPNYFYVQDISGSDNTLSITKNNNSAPTVEVFKSTDRMNWVSMGSTSTTAITATIPANSKLYLRCSTNVWGTSSYYNVINTAGNCNVGGNIMSLLYGTNFTGEETTFQSGSSYNFRFLFNNNTYLINASDLLLPATTLTEGCYRQMFQNCSSLTTAPVLPATTLVSNCYRYMFSYCTSLATAPILPATTLASNCYEGMFSSCSSLTTAPELPATTLVSSCYRSMFDSCRNLNRIVTYANDISATNCTFSWLNNVAATGYFYNLGSATYPTGDPSGIPSGWTEHSSL